MKKGVKIDAVNLSIGGSVGYSGVCDEHHSQKKNYISSSSVYVYDPLMIWYQPDNANLQTGDVISIGVDGGVPPYTYEWQTVGESGAVQIPDAPNENCIFPDELNLEAGTSVICVVTDGP